MPEEQTESTEAQDAQKEPADKEEPDWKTEADKWKALARKHEGNAKANADAAKRLKDLEDSDKSEVEKLRESATAAERRASEAEAKALRAEVAHEKGLSPAQAKRLIGSTREELESDADELLSAFTKPSDDKSDTKSRRPKEKLRPGASNESDDDFDPKKIADAVSARSF